MAVLEVIGEAFGRIFVEIIFKGIILRAANILNDGLTFTWRKITGQKIAGNKTIPKSQHEGKLLYKKIELIENLNSLLRKGQQGVILEIIDKNKVFAEFYDCSHKQIEVDNEIVFEVDLNQFRLIE